MNGVKFLVGAEAAGSDGFGVGARGFISDGFNAHVCQGEIEIVEARILSIIFFDPAHIPG